MTLPNRLFESPIGHLYELLRILCLGAAVGVVAALSGCASFSPDGGMSVANPSGIAAHELKKDTIAIRTPEDAASDAGPIRISAQAALDRRRGRADRAPQQSRPPSGL
jgi:hypothetical protein